MLDRGRQSSQLDHNVGLGEAPVRGGTLQHCTRVREFAESVDRNPRDRPFMRRRPERLFNLLVSLRHDPLRNCYCCATPDTLTAWSALRDAPVCSPLSYLPVTVTRRAASALPMPRGPSRSRGLAAMAAMLC